MYVYSTPSELVAEWDSERTRWSVLGRRGESSVDEADEGPRGELLDGRADGWAAVVWEGECPLAEEECAG